MHWCASHRLTASLSTPLGQLTFLRKGRTTEESRVLAEVLVPARHSGMLGALFSLWLCPQDTQPQTWSLDSAGWQYSCAWFHRIQSLQFCGQ